MRANSEIKAQRLPLLTGVLSSYLWKQHGREEEESLSTSHCPPDRSMPTFKTNKQKTHGLLQDMFSIKQSNDNQSILEY